MAKFNFVTSLAVACMAAGCLLLAPSTESVVACNTSGPIGKVLCPILNLVDEVSANLYAQLDSLIHDLATLGSNLDQAVILVVNTITSAIDMVFNQLVTAVQSVINILTGVLSIVSGVLQGVGAMLANVIGAVLNLVLGLFGKVLALLIKLPLAITDAALNVVGSLLSHLLKIVASIVGLVFNVIAAILNNKILKDIIGEVSYLVNILVNLVYALGQIVDNLLSLLGTLPERVEAIVKNLLQLVAAVLRGILTGVKNLIQELTKISGDAAKALCDTLGNLIKTITGILEKISSKISIDNSIDISG